jgi:hypothetical protein
MRGSMMFEKILNRVMAPKFYNEYEVFMRVESGYTSSEHRQIVTAESKLDAQDKAKYLVLDDVDTKNPFNRPEIFVESVKQLTFHEKEEVACEKDSWGIF